MTAGLKQITIIRPNPWTNPVRVHYALYRDDTVWCVQLLCGAQWTSQELVCAM